MRLRANGRSSAIFSHFFFISNVTRSESVRKLHYLRLILIKGKQSKAKQSNTKHSSLKEFGTKQVTYLALAIVNNNKSVVGVVRVSDFCKGGWGVREIERLVLCRLCGKSSSVDLINSDMIFIY